MAYKVLIVEDKDNLRVLLGRLLREEGYETKEASSAEEALEVLRRETFHVVLTDLRLPGKDGLEVLRAAKAADAHVQVIVMTAYGSIESSVQAVKAGAFDYLTKPVENDLLLHTLKQALESRRLQLDQTLRRQEEDDWVIGRSQAFRKVLELAEQCAPTDATVLLLGETGTGKERLARWIHRRSKRAKQSFVVVNCAALAPGVLESELFGHEKGAFTGAVQRHIGRFEAAEGGTLFLDEIAEMPLEAQAKLLRVIQEKTFQRVGGNQELTCDVRLIAATNRDLAEETRRGRFREDLFYRLNVVPIALPPLRERREDIAEFVDWFLKRFGRELGRPLKVTPAALEKLERHLWPGNIRELEHVLYRAALLSKGTDITEKEVLVEPMADEEKKTPLKVLSENTDWRELFRREREAAERRVLEEVLKKTGGNKSLAARYLSLSYKTLLQKIKKLGLR